MEVKITWIPQGKFFQHTQVVTYDAVFAINSTAIQPLSIILWTDPSAPLNKKEPGLESYLILHFTLFSLEPRESA